jgi:hypothetical protein
MPSVQAISDNAADNNPGPSEVSHCAGANKSDFARSVTTVAPDAAPIFNSGVERYRAGAYAEAEEIFERLHAAQESTRKTADAFRPPAGVVLTAVEVRRSLDGATLERSANCKQANLTPASARSSARADLPKIKTYRRAARR